ncbi:hypothetical protein MMC07_003636 [Pseudocyphellaria aurata]|nr:hypothetical protein [Pseudocyphellaria aurata]
MPLKVQEIASDAEFDEMIPLQWVSYEQPFNPFLIMYCPVRGTGPTARADSIQESKERQLQWHRADPSSHWLKVVDTDTGAAIGGAQWNIYESDPFAKPPEHPFTAYWWEEGEKRQFIDEALGQWIGPRMERMRRPHLLLNMCFVHPDHRRRGAGHLLVEWGIKKADEMGVELFVESTDDGKPLYDRHGLVTMNEMILKPSKPNPGDEWKSVEKELGPMRLHFMWRPVGGKYEEGKTIVPWETQS